MRLLTGFLVVLLNLAGAGCSRGTVSELPTAPTRSIAVLTITPVGGWFFAEGTTTPINSSGGLPSTGAALGAFAQYSDGSGSYVPATWTSSSPDVISVESGAFVAKSVGITTMTASAQGRTASQTFTVEDIAGTWTGTYVVEQCVAGGGSIDEVICYPMNQGRTAGMLAVGVVAPMTLQITRSGNDLSAAAQFGDIRGTLTGIHRGTNLFTLAGNLNSNAASITFFHWDARVFANAMNGFIGFEVRIAGLPSHAQVAARLDNVTRR
jgi:hypothetical protein